MKCKTSISLNSDKVEKTSYQYSNGSYSLTGHPVFGYITSGGEECDLYVFTSKAIQSASSGINITKLDGSYIRHISGGYVIGSNQDITSYISRITKRTDNCFEIRLNKTGGFGVTNNTPIAGTINIAFTLS